MFKIEIKGLVQGVGFRPFIYNLAESMQLSGSVANSSYGVEIYLQASKIECDAFIDAIYKNAPTLSHIEFLHSSEIQTSQTFKSFHIVESLEDDNCSAHILEDIAMCDACRDELEESSNRRYQYPFISCTNCGPRYSMIEALPYDRENTSMREFPMCSKCQSEYTDPKDRRYHAQSIGCYECGPQFFLIDKNGSIVECENIVDRVVDALKSGKIVALKGIGGYHLLCDAESTQALKTLREKKQRLAKPFALMVKDMEMAKDIAQINRSEEKLLSSHRSPIVLLKAKKDLHPLIAPNIESVGLFLAYTPLHYLLLSQVGGALVVTSANLKSEPLCRTQEQIMNLSLTWDLLVEHDREIVNSCDDSIAFVEEEKTFLLRQARGFSPKYLKLPFKAKKNVLALGANQKSSVAIVMADYALLSPYIGDLESLASFERYKREIENLKKIHNYKVDTIVCDKHPAYISTQYAKSLQDESSALELLQVQHHYAHILAIMGLHGLNSKVLGVSFDGTGYGDDGKLWGSEFILCDYKSYERVAHFKYFKLLGGEMAIKEPRRIALSLLFDIYGERAKKLNNSVIDAFTKSEIDTLFIAWSKNLNAPLTSSCGRVFDAVASMLGLLQLSSFEGESGLLLESYYDENIQESYNFHVEKGVIDLDDMLIAILGEENSYQAVSKFFNTLVEIIYYLYKQHQLPLILSGGVFQNRVLLRLVMKKVPLAVVPKDFICNDASIAYGQLLFALAKD